jgi:predicted nucleic acid-binding protein
MISLDTNVILAALTPKDEQHEMARKWLTKYDKFGFVISPIVYSELRASAAWKAIEVFLEASNISVIWTLDEATFELAGVSCGLFAQLRKNGKLPRRILADFLIGAHAQQNGLSLMTFDSVVYEAVFKKVKLVGT